MHIIETDENKKLIERPQRIVYLKEENLKSQGAPEF